MSETERLDFDLRVQLPEMADRMAVIYRALARGRVPNDMYTILALVAIAVSEMRRAGNDQTAIMGLTAVVFKAFEDGLIESVPHG